MLTETTRRRFFPPLAGMTYLNTAADVETFLRALHQALAAAGA